MAVIAASARACRRALAFSFAISGALGLQRCLLCCSMAPLPPALPRVTPLLPQPADDQPALSSDLAQASSAQIQPSR